MKTIFNKKDITNVQSFKAHDTYDSSQKNFKKKNKSKSYYLLIVILTCSILLLILGGLSLLIYYFVKLNSTNHSEFCIFNESCIREENLVCHQYSCKCISGVSWSGNSCESNEIDSTSVSLGVGNHVPIPTKINASLFSQSTESKIVITEYDNVTITGIWGITEVYRNNTQYYYFTEFIHNNIVIVNENGSFVDKKKYWRPYYITASNEHIYYTDGTNRFYKLNFDLTVIMANTSGCFLINPCLIKLQGIHFDKKSNLLFIADSDAHGIHILHENFTRRIFLPLLTKPISVNLLNELIYVGDYMNNIYVIDDNATIIETKKNVCSSLNQIWSVSLDIDGSLIYPCYMESKVYLKYLNESILTMPTIGNPGFVFFDSKARLLVATDNKGTLSIFF